MSSRPEDDLVRHPDFARRARAIVVEFASTSEQSTLDRYVRGEDVTRAQLERVWKTTTQGANGVWDSPTYADFFAAVRDVNAKLPADGRVQVFGGDPGPGDNRSRDGAAVSVLKEQVLQKQGKAVVIYGAAHFYRTDPGTSGFLSGIGGGIAKTSEADYPGRTFVVIPVGGPIGPLPPGTDGGPDPQFRKFDGAVKTQVRPVLLSLQRSPFANFTAEEFIGRTMLTCRPGVCVSVFKGSTLTLRLMADACVYFGNAPATDTRAAR